MLEYLIINLDSIPREFVALFGMFLLFIGTKFFQRYHVPSAISAVALGALSNVFYPWAGQDHLLSTFSILGISSLFLFAGLEVEIDEIKNSKKQLLLISAAYLIFLFVTQLAVSRIFGISPGAAWIAALGILTPSAGFILENVGIHFSDADKQAWVKQTTISLEIVSLAVLFFIVQSSSIARLFFSVILMVSLVVLLPRLFRLFARVILPYAPKTEFSFLILIACTMAMVTKALGVYYLVGAFFVGVTARPFIRTLPKDDSEKLTHAIDVFSAFFVIFYFFSAGTRISMENLTPDAFLVGFLGALFFIPMRLAFVSMFNKAHSSSLSPESWKSGMVMVPTLVFGLVMLGILREKFNAPSNLLGGLLVYTAITTVLPGAIRARTTRRSARETSAIAREPTR